MILATPPRYTVRYRSSDRRGKTALIVEDNTGTAYLFSGGALQGRVSGADATTRLVARLGNIDHWQQVPRVAPYTIDGLRQMTD